MDSDPRLLAELAEMLTSRPPEAVSLHGEKGLKVLQEIAEVRGDVIDARFDKSLRLKVAELTYVRRKLGTVEKGGRIVGVSVGSHLS